MFDEDQSLPLLLEQRKDGYYIYDYETDDYVLKYGSTRILKPKRVERLAYLQFVFNTETRRVEERVFSITADYDELASIGRKIYPFQNTRDGIKTRVTTELYKQLAHHKSTPVDLIYIAASVILESELEERRKHRERPFIKSIGIANELQWASKIFLKGETDGATTHGAEVDSPFPQIITPGNYPVFLPSGEIRILHNEEEICDFINQQRALGFLLDVNPKWGWQEGDGELFIPEHRFDWELVHNGLRAQQVDIESLESKKESGVPFDRNEELELLILMRRNIDDTELMNLKVAIERLILEPPIMYSQFINNYLDKPEEDEEEKEFRLKIQKKIKQMELDVRRTRIDEAIKKYEDKLREYISTYNESSWVGKAEQKMLDAYRSTKSLTK